MTSLEMPIVCWLFGVVELLGLVSAWAARLSEGSQRQTLCQHLFFACMALVGTATLVSFGLGPACWLASAVTLAVMVLTVTCDFSRTRPVADG